MTKFKALFEPVKIGNKMVKNRFALPPMILGEATPDGYVTRNMIDRYRDIAEGGVGMMVVEGVAVNTPGSKGIGGLIARNNNLQGLANIATEVKLHGALAMMQVLHCGRQALPEANNGVQPVSVSDIPFWMGTKFAPTPRAATLEELEVIKQEFVNAAILAQNAGFDGIEVHCAHGYLLATFLSAKVNNREDEYGGSWEARMRYPLSVVQAIRESTEKNFIVGARISASYAIEGEPDIDDMSIFAKKLEEIGVDYISVSGGTYESHWKQSPPCYLKRNSNIEEAARIKKEVSVPILVAGGICYPEEANEFVEKGMTDLVCLGRALFADPDFPNKVKFDKLDEIRPCIRCNLEFGDTFRQHQARCSVNFQMGREKEYEIRPAMVKKNVMIVGGGPGGMEAARVAALRGHEVNLFEKSKELGGSLVVASAPSHKEEIGRLLAYFKHQMELNHIHVHTGVEVNDELVRQIEPDALIVATGARPSIPPIPGIDRACVVVGEDVLMHRADTGERIVVAGGGCVGIDVVLQLTEEGKHVVLVEKEETFGKDLDVISWAAVEKLFKQLEEEGKLEIKTRTAIKEIRDDCVIVTDVDGTDRQIGLDSLVLALGYTPSREVSSPLTSIIPETYLVGDASDARRIRHAIHEGFIAGFTV